MALILVPQSTGVLDENAVRFRWCQTDDFLTLVDVLSGLRSVGVPYATGGGKTLLSLALGAWLIQNGVFDRVLILTPSKVIAEHFERYSGRLVCPTHDEFEPFYIGAVKRVTTGRDLIKSFSLLISDDVRARIIVATHQMFTTNFVEGSDFTRNLLADRRTWVVVDEAQHCPWRASDLVVEAADEQERKQILALGQGVSRLRRDGFVTGKFSGTATRSDGLPVFADTDYTEVGRSLHQLMLYGMCPQELCTEVVHVEGLSANNDDSSWIPIEPDKGAWAVQSIWNKYDRVPACVRVKPRDKDDNDKAIKAIKDLLGDAAIDASGEAALDFDRALKAEAEAIKTKTAVYSDYQTVFVGMTRIVTGVDSPSRALGILYGIPRSTNVLLQFLGRDLRLKIDYDTGVPLFIGYPRNWINRVQLVFLVGGSPNEADRQEEHFGVMFRALALVESLNYAAMFGKMFRQVYDGMRGSRSGDKSSAAARAAKEAEILELVTSESPRLLLEAELDLIATESPLDSTPYKAQKIDGRLRLIEGWLRARARHAAEQDGQLERAEIDSAVETAVANELPGIQALLLIRKATESPSSMARAQQVLSSIEDRSLQEKVQALFEEFKEALPETTAGYLLDAKLIEHYRTKAALIFEKASPLSSVAEVLKRVSEYQERNNGFFPGLDDVDPLNPSVSFATHDKHLSTGHYEEFTGELGELLIQRDATPWWQEAREVAERFLDPLYQPRGLPTGLLKDRAGKSRLQRLQEMFGDRAVVRYYPRAVLVAAALQGAEFICSEEFLRALTLPEAQRLGGRPRLNSLLAELQGIFATGGIEAVRERLVVR